MRGAGRGGASYLHDDDAGRELQGGRRIKGGREGERTGGARGRWSPGECPGERAREEGEGRVGEGVSK